MRSVVVGWKAQTRRTVSLLHLALVLILLSGCAGPTKGTSPLPSETALPVATVEMLPTVMPTAAPAATTRAASHGKKIIEYGWDIPTAQFVEQNVSDMENHPFDGIVFTISGDNPYAFDTRPWNKGDMQLDTLAQIQWRKFTDNFLLLWLSNRQCGLVQRHALADYCGQHALVRERGKDR